MDAQAIIDALDKWLYHTAGCSVMKVSPSSGCSCGLDAEVKRLTEPLASRPHLDIEQIAEEEVLDK